MKLERKHAWILVGVAIWNVVTFSTFAKNLYAAHSSGEDRPAGYWIAHTVLIVVNFAIAGVLGSIGVKALRASRSGPAESAEGAPDPTHTPV